MAFTGSVVEKTPPLHEERPSPHPDAAPRPIRLKKNVKYLRDLSAGSGGSESPPVLTTIHLIEERRAISRQISESISACLMSEFDYLDKVLMRAGCIQQYAVIREHLTHRLLEINHKHPTMVRSFFQNNDSRYQSFQEEPGSKLGKRIIDHFLFLREFKSAEGALVFSVTINAAFFSILYPNIFKMLSPEFKTIHFSHLESPDRAPPGRASFFSESPHAATPKISSIESTDTESAVLDILNILPAVRVLEPPIAVVRDDSLVKFLYSDLLPVQHLHLLATMPEDFLQNGEKSRTDPTYHGFAFKGFAPGLRILAVDLVSEKINRLSDDELNSYYDRIRTLIQEEAMIVNARLLACRQTNRDACLQKVALRGLLAYLPENMTDIEEAKRRTQLVTAYSAFMHRNKVYADIHLEGRALAEHFKITLILNHDQVVHQGPENTRVLHFQHSGCPGLAAHYSIFGATEGGGNCLFNAFSQGISDIYVKEYLEIPEGRSAQQQRYAAFMNPCQTNLEVAAACSRPKVSSVVVACSPALSVLVSSGSAVTSGSPDVLYPSKKLNSCFSPLKRLFAAPRPPVATNSVHIAVSRPPVRNPLQVAVPRPATINSVHIAVSRSPVRNPLQVAVPRPAAANPVQATVPSVATVFIRSKYVPRPSPYPCPTAPQSTGTPPSC